MFTETNLLLLCNYLSFLMQMQQSIIFLLSARLNWPRRKFDQSPLSCTEVKNARSFTCTAPYAFMACTGQFYPYFSFYLYLSGMWVYFWATNKKPDSFRLTNKDVQWLKRGYVPLYYFPIHLFQNSLKIKYFGQHFHNIICRKICGFVEFISQINKRN